MGFSRSTAKQGEALLAHQATRVNANRTGKPGE